MRRDFAFHLIIAFTMLLLLLTQQVFSKEPPDGVLVLKPGGYVFADYPGIFDAYNDKGITIEGLMRYALLKAGVMIPIKKR